VTTRNGFDSPPLTLNFGTLTSIWSPPDRSRSIISTIIHDSEFSGCIQKKGTPFSPSVLRVPVTDDILSFSRVTFRRDSSFIPGFPSGYLLLLSDPCPPGLNPDQGRSTMAPATS